MARYEHEHKHIYFCTCAAALCTSMKTIVTYTCMLNVASDMSGATMDNPVSSINIKASILENNQWSCQPLSMDYPWSIHGPSTDQHSAWPPLSKYPWMPELLVRPRTIHGGTTCLCSVRKNNVAQNSLFIGMRMCNFIKTGLAKTRQAGPLAIAMYCRWLWSITINEV